MPKKLLDFAAQIGLSLTTGQADTLLRYAQCVWQKKDFLNLTSAASLEEILLRHICDGLQGACQLQKLAHAAKQEKFSLIDAGAGAGYIGLTAAVALPQAKVILVESLEKRCAFMNWVLLSLGIKNVQIKNVRLGEKKDLQADFVTERAMGQLPDILGICLSAVRAGGIFMAYQGAPVQTATLQADIYGARLGEEISYRLPPDYRTRYLALFHKGLS